MSGVFAECCEKIQKILPSILENGVETYNVIIAVGSDCNSVDITDLTTNNSIQQYEQGFVVETKAFIISTIKEIEENKAASSRKKSKFKFPVYFSFYYSDQKFVKIESENDFILIEESEYLRGEDEVEVVCEIDDKSKIKVELCCGIEGDEAKNYLFIQPN